MKLVLAPLADFTNAAFRKLAYELGADLTYTEMVSAAALAHGSSPTRHLFEKLPGEGPVACQLFGHTPDDLAFAAREATALKRFVSIDLNAGCPMPRIRREGDGAALVPKPQLVHDLLVAIKRETDLPVTLKTRPGPSPDRVTLFELLDAAETAGCSGFTLHARFTSEMHGGPVHLDLLAELVQRAHIPVTGNGGVHDEATLKAMLETGVDAVMLGRAAITNPAIFAAFKGLSAPSRKELYLRHIEYLLDLQGQLSRNFPNDHVPPPDGFVSVALHRHLFHYFRGIPGAAEIRRRLNTIRTLAETRALAESFPSMQNV